MNSADPHYLEVRLADATLTRGGRDVLRDAAARAHSGRSGAS